MIPEITLVLYVSKKLSSEENKIRETPEIAFTNGITNICLSISGVPRLEQLITKQFMQ